MKSTTYEKFIKLDIDFGEINFEPSDYNRPYFCTPVGAEILGWESGIHYCFINGFGETVFAVNPESCVDYNAYPVAENFTDFLTLVISTGSRNPVEQIINFSSFADFDAFVNSKEEQDWFSRPEHIQAIEKIKSYFHLQPIALKDVYNYVRNLQANFDYDKIEFTDEYYELTGKPKPDGSFVANETPVEFEPVIIAINRN